MNRAGIAVTGLLALLFGATPARAQASASPAPVGAQDKSADLFLNMESVDLGAATPGDKKQFMNTVELEKSRLTRRMLSDVYDNAFELYREGDFEGARRLTATILSIDPTYEDAAVLQRAAEQLNGTQSPGLSERQLADQKFEQGLSLYKQGRVVEAAALWREVAALAPYNLKAKAWLKRADDDIAAEHFSKGEDLYKQGRLREALDEFYSAFIREPRYPKLQSVIDTVEQQYQDQQAQDLVQEALASYGKGDLAGTADLLKQALETSPGNAQAANLYAQVRNELASRQVAEARRLEAVQDYDGAIEAWRRAGDYGYDPVDEEAQIARLRDAVKREALRKQEEARLAKKRAEERKLAAAAAKKKKQQEAEQQQDEGGGEEGGEGSEGGGSQGLGINAAPSMQTMGEGAAAGAGSGSGSGSGSAAAAPAAPAPHVPTQQDKQNAATHYGNALIYFQENKLDQAYNEVTLSLQLDPSNADADSLKQRIEAARNQ